MFLEFHHRNGVQLANHILNAVDEMRLALLEPVPQYLLHQQLPILCLYLLRKCPHPALQSFLCLYLLLRQLHIGLHQE